MIRLIIASIACLLLLGCKSKKPAFTEEDYDTISLPGKPEINETFLPQYISKVTREIKLDGDGSEPDWDNAVWRNMDQLIMSTMPSEQDFKGRYKLLWNEDMIYVLAEIQDDVFMDIHPDGLDRYWDDDCLQIFVDEDQSGGIHQYDYNAFAYHLSLDGKVVDMDHLKKPTYFNEHIESSQQRNGNTIIWELGVHLYNDRYNPEDSEASRVKLDVRKKIGFMVAYSDNDTSAEREHFMGDMFIPGEEKKQGAINAGVFGQLYLK